MKKKHGIQVQQEKVQEAIRHTAAAGPVSGDVDEVGTI